VTTLRLGTRASALAQWQAHWVASRLQSLGVDVTLVPITTVGDRHLGTLHNMGGQGVFTKEIQQALLEDRIDLAVHSLKDLPTIQPPELVLAVVPERGPVGDVLVTRDENCRAVDQLPIRARVGTGSLRRQAQLLHIRRDLVLEEIRGNVDTRLRKLREGEFDAIILAEAGLRRLGFLGDDATATDPPLIYSFLPQTQMMPAIGQGALGLETRADDQATREKLAPLDHAASHFAVLAERAMLASLQGGCLAPIAALGSVASNTLTLTGRVLSRDGAMLLEASDTMLIDGSVTHAVTEELGRTVAADLRKQGAEPLILNARRD
jgi:hydroxymethylbilane synthase